MIVRCSNIKCSQFDLMNPLDCILIIVLGLSHSFLSFLILQLKTTSPVLLWKALHYIIRNIILFRSLSTIMFWLRWLMCNSELQMCHGITHFFLFIMHCFLPTSDIPRELIFCLWLLFDWSFAKYFTKVYKRVQSKFT